MFLFSKNPIHDYAHALEMLLRGKLWLQALIALTLGVLTGLLLGPDLGWMPETHAAVITAWIALPGELFLRLVKMILVPLIVASIIQGIAGTADITKLKTLGVKLFLYILCTTSVAILIGITIAKLLQPGAYVTPPSAVDAMTVLTQQQGDTLPSLEELPLSIVNLIPINPLASAMQGEMLAIVIFAIIFAVAFAMQKNKRTAALLDLTGGVLDVCMTIVKWAMLLVPLAVFGLTARMVAQVGISTLLGMGVYVSAVLLGLVLLLIFYCCIIAAFGRRNPFTFLHAIGSVQLLAFSTSSSAAVMPFSIKTAQEKLNISKEASEVIIPLGATMNMDGTALYQSIALLFLAQMSGIVIPVPQMALIALTLVASSIGAPGTPGAGMVILSGIALQSGIPVSGLVLIMGVDRILDMCRTVINVTGDLTACVVFGQERKQRLFRIFSKNP